MGSEIMNLKIHAKNKSYEFQALDGQSILLAGLSNSIDLPYACATGTCGTCKAKLISGEVKDNWPDALGKSKLKADSGELLLCQCSAQSECELEVPDFVYQQDPGSCRPNSYQGTISQWRKLTPDVAVWTVDLDDMFSFDAGQFALLQLSGVDGFRAYSMVNFDRQTQRLTFLTKRKLDGELTNILFSESPVGKTVQLLGPFGRAVFSPNLKKNILCIAGGSGIAGILSILSRAAQEGFFKQYKGDIFFGVRTMKDAFFLEELSRLQSSCGNNLRIVVGISEGDITENEMSQFPALLFDKGYIHEIAAKHMEGRYKNVQAYLAGPTVAVDAAIRHLVIEAKFDPKSIAYDKFS